MTLKGGLQPTIDCLAIDRFGEELTGAERAHLGTCVRCQAEFALWQEFVQSKPTADEGVAVKWVVSELHRRAAPWRPPVHAFPARSPFRRRLRPLLGFSAAAVLATGVAYLGWDREPGVPVTEPGPQIYRTGTLEVIGPTGDLSVAPREIKWEAVEGAVSYDVSVLEVDRTVLWRTTSPRAEMRLPDDVVAQIVPGKTLLWDVTALDRSGTPIATSGVRRFRVSVNPPPRRE